MKKSKNSLHITSKRLLELRTERELSISDVVSDLEKAGYNLSKSTISRYENDQREPTMQNIVILARYYAVSLDYLLGLSDNKLPKYSPELILKTPEGEPLIQSHSNSNLAAYYYNMYLKLRSDGNEKA